MPLCGGRDEGGVPVARVVVHFDPCCHQAADGTDVAPVGGGDEAVALAQVAITGEHCGALAAAGFAHAAFALGHRAA